MVVKLYSCIYEDFTPPFFSSDYLYFCDWSYLTANREAKQENGQAEAGSRAV